MKRTFPVIIILISLSLFGLLLLQGSWLKNLLEVRESQLYNKISKDGLEVAEGLYKSVYNGKIMRPRKGGIGGFNHNDQGPYVNDKLKLLKTN